MRIRNRKLKTKCTFCGKILFLAPYKIKRVKRNFCDRQCFGNSKKGIPLSNKAKLRIKETWIKKMSSQQLQKCLMCGKKFHRKPFRVKRGEGKYCSRVCKDKHMRGERSPSWLGGKSFEPYGLEFNNELKKQIRKRDNHTCQECGYTQEQLGYKLHPHHIDYDKKNNDPKNLISLCKSCHMKTNFSRADWTKYFNNKVTQEGGEGVNLYSSLNAG